MKLWYSRDEGEANVLAKSIGTLSGNGIALAITWNRTSSRSRNLSSYSRDSFSFVLPSTSGHF